MIIRIEIYKFKSRQGRIALSSLREHVALVSRYRGCLEARIARSPEDQDQFLVYSRWDSPESYSTMAINIRRSPESQKALLPLVQLIEREPTISHFEVLDG